MPRRPFKLDQGNVVLPRGTRVTLRVDLIGDDGYRHKTASLATVVDVAQNTYALKTPAGRPLTAQRDQLALQRQDLLADLGHRQWDFRRLEEGVIYSAVVGSQAWGLSDENSDEDVRGCFVLPFDSWAGLWDAPDEIHDPRSDAAYWEVEKLITQGLRGDANTLEVLWSPLHKIVTPLGQGLLDSRDMFTSMNILGSFGRYAQSQFHRIERSLVRNAAIEELLGQMETGVVASVEKATEILVAHGHSKTTGDGKREVLAMCRSLFDRGLTAGAEFGAVMSALAEGRRATLTPPRHRPKNAYNLLRLLHSCLHWLKEGTPLIEVTGSLRDNLLAIKRQEVPIEQVVAQAKSLADALNDEAEASRLPQQPDYEAADEFLRRCRREAAKVSLAVSGRADGRSVGRGGSSGSLVGEVLPVALPPDIQPSRLRPFLDSYLNPESGPPLKLVWVAIAGAHAYGFVSPDSDLDVKAIHVAPASEHLGLQPPPDTVDFLGDWQGREYDFTSNELGQACRLILAGNGNILERLLCPLVAFQTQAGRELSALAQASLSQRLYKHYSGFFRGMVREYGVEKKKGLRKAKRLLYAYRVALSGAHALRTGEVVADIRPLAQRYGFERVAELIEIKGQSELESLGESLAGSFESDFAKLAEMLDGALAESVLPEEPANTAAFEAFVIRTRMDA